MPADYSKPGVDWVALSGTREHAGDGLLEALQVEWLIDHVDARGIERGDVGAAGHEDESMTELGVLGSDVVQEIDAGAIRHDDVAEDYVELPPSDARASVGIAAGERDLVMKPEDAPERRTHRRIVVHNKEAHDA